jgi:predicted AAA+ superfamily ATPase
MIKRPIITTNLQKALKRQSAVGLLGPRQVGKTTLAQMIAEKRPSIYLDLESPQDRAKLSEPELFLKDKENKLVILDEIHRAPELFPVLRGIIDRGRRKGKSTGRFLVLGSASMDLMRQSSESLAGRIEYIYLNPLHVLEIEDSNKSLDRLWLRGGFPNSYLAKSEVNSFNWRLNFIRTYLERDVMQFAPRIAIERLERLWQMLAHSQSTFLNIARLASGLSVSTHTVNNYIGLLIDLLLVRRLPAYHKNKGKRLVKSPKIYLRDSGLLHALLGIRNRDELLGHPILGPSWEGFVLENLLSVVPPHVKAYVYRSSAGAEMDLVLELGGKKGIWAIEIKHGLEPKPTRGFYSAIDDIKPQKAFIVYSGRDSYPLAKNIEVIGLHKMAQLLEKV